MIYFYNQHLKKARNAAIKFSNLGFIKQAQKNKKRSLRKHLEFILSSLLIFFLILGLADLHIPLKQTKEGVNVVLALDVSGSMQATDYKPNRLESAKSSAKILINSLKSKDHVGIVIFESGATTAAYLSPFKDMVLSKLENIAPKDGRTAIGDGLSLAIDMASSIPNKKKVVILLSDGVSNSGVISPDEAISFAKDNKIQVHTIGMGSDEQTILGYDYFGNPQYAELDEKTLKNIAINTGGKYFKSVNSETLDDVYEDISKDLEREKELTSIKDWFFILSLFMVGLLIYFKYGKYRIIR